MALIGVTLGEMALISEVDAILFLVEADAKPAVVRLFFGKTGNNISSNGIAS